MRTNCLKAKIIENGFSISNFAEAVGIERSRIYRKLKAPGTFTVEEIEKIADVLKLSPNDILFIFFGREVA